MTSWHCFFLFQNTHVSFSFSFLIGILHVLSDYCPLNLLGKGSISISACVIYDKDMME